MISIWPCVPARSPILFDIVNNRALKNINNNLKQILWNFALISWNNQSKVKIDMFYGQVQLIKGVKRAFE